MSGNNKYQPILRIQILLRKKIILLIIGIIISGFLWSLPQVQAVQNTIFDKPGLKHGYFNKHKAKETNTVTPAIYNYRLGNGGAPVTYSVNINEFLGGDGSEASINDTNRLLGEVYRGQKHPVNLQSFLNLVEVKMQAAEQDQDTVIKPCVEKTGKSRQQCKTWMTRGHRFILYSAAQIPQSQTRTTNYQEGVKNLIEKPGIKSCLVYMKDGVTVPSCDPGKPNKIIPKINTAINQRYDDVVGYKNTAPSSIALAVWEGDNPIWVVRLACANPLGAMKFPSKEEVKVKVNASATNIEIDQTDKNIVFEYEIEKHIAGHNKHTIEYQFTGQPEASLQPQLTIKEITPAEALNPTRKPGELVGRQLDIGDQAPVAKIKLTETITVNADNIHTMSQFSGAGGGTICRQVRAKPKNGQHNIPPDKVSSLTKTASVCVRVTMVVPGKPLAERLEVIDITPEMGVVGTRLMPEDYNGINSYVSRKIQWVDQVTQNGDFDDTENANIAYEQDSIDSHGDSDDPIEYPNLPRDDLPNPPSTDGYGFINNLEKSEKDAYERADKECQKMGGNLPPLSNRGEFKIDNESLTICSATQAIQVADGVIIDPITGKEEPVYKTVIKCVKYDKVHKTELTGPCIRQSRSGKETSNSGNGSGGVHTTPKKSKAKWFLTKLIFKPRPEHAHDTSLETRPMILDTTKDPCQYYSQGVADKGDFICQPVLGGEDTFDNQELYGATSRKDPDQLTFTIVTPEEGSPAFDGRDSTNGRNKGLATYKYDLEKLPTGTKVCFGLSVNPWRHEEKYLGKKPMGGPKEGTTWKQHTVAEGLSVTLEVTHWEWAHSQPKCITVSKKPYFEVQNGMLVAGGRIITNSATYDNNKYGSWSEYSAKAAGDISKLFATNSALSGGGNVSLGIDKQHALTFSNTNQTKLGNFGQINADFTDTNAFFNNLSTEGRYAATKVYKHGTSETEISSLQPGVHIFNSDVTIKQNISSNDQIVVIVNGDLTIDRNVTEVNAWLIASGTLYTSDRPLNEQNVRDGVELDKPLLVNGQVRAKAIKLRRTAGSGYTGTITNLPSSVLDKELPQAAEIFKGNPKTYVWSYRNSLDKGQMQTVYLREVAPRY